jgi:hypothetical protein
MGLLDAVFGRRKPVGPNLDSLFAVPSAAITVQAALDFIPTGRAAVAFRAPEGRAFAEIEADVRALLDADAGPPVEITEDRFGYDWVVLATDPVDVVTAVTDAHAVNVSLVEAGFGPQLLCSLVSFRGPDDRQLALVYLFKAGTFYPFAPTQVSDEQRNNVLELQVLDLLEGELPMEKNLGRWFAVWNAPGRDVWAPLVACGSGPGKREHSIERDLRPMLGIGIDIDLVDDMASRQTLQRPHQMG